MKIVHVNSNVRYTSAPLRIMEATQDLGCETKLVTLNSIVDNDNVVVLKKNIKERIYNKYLSKIEKIKKDKYLITVDFPFSYGESGIDLTRFNLIRDADIIHFHWICGQFIGHDTIKKLIKIGKPIVWTFHDSWPMTGGCHLRYDCERFAVGCGQCPGLHSRDKRDITYDVMRKKKRVYNCTNISTVSPSMWMYDNVCKSLLFKESNNYQIGNPLDFDIYKPINRENKNKKTVILFGAYSTLEEAKGYQQFKEALNILKNRVDTNEFLIKIFGTEEYEINELEGFQVSVQGYIRSFEKMNELYNEADVYVFPSLIDNLPGTVMESLACETPVVCFDKNGTPELVLHKQDGYIAKAEDAKDLADGIEWVLNNNLNNVLGKRGRKDMYLRFNKQYIGELYLQVYKECLEKYNEI